MMGKTTQTVLVAVSILCSVLIAPKAMGEDGKPEETTTSTGAVIVLLPGGEFQMGDPDGDVDEIPHSVTLSPFYMDKYEVTQELYQQIVEENPSKWKGKANPVETVRWSDVARFCNKRSLAEGLEPAYDLENWTCNFEAAGYRLPTEAEWEYAARVGSTTSYPFGSSDSRLREHAWYTRNAAKKTHPVGKLEPNAWGLHDMLGNVMEWCNDFYQVDYYPNSPKTDPTGPEKGNTRVVRGGCWRSNPDSCRSSYRYNENPAYTDACFGYEVYGFRCVRRADGK